MGRKLSRPARYRSAGEGLPEDAVDHIDDAAAARIDEQRVVIIAHPAIGTIGRRQAVLPRIADRVAMAVEQ